MVRTPEDVKKGLRFCSREHQSAEPLCNICPYDDGGFNMVACTGHLSQDALAYIQQLEQELAAVKRERDAAVASIGEYRFCVDCKHIDASKADEPCRTCLNDETASKGGWEWRGVCPENTEVSPDA